MSTVRLRGVHGTEGKKRLDCVMGVKAEVTDEVCDLFLRDTFFLDFAFIRT